MMVHESVTLDDAIGFLNELIEIDSSAVRALVLNRALCNQKLADHPTVQVVIKDRGYRVGLLGIINGLFGVFGDEAGAIAGYGPIKFVFNEGGNLLRAERTDAAVTVVKES